VTAKAGLEVDDLDLIVPHQANRRIIEAAARGLSLPVEKFMINLDRYGNTSSASIPIAVAEAVEFGRIEPGDNLVLVGFGAGLTWGAVALQWVAAEKEIPSVRIRQRRARAVLSHVRSWLRRLLRRIEGLIFGARAEGDNPKRNRPDRR
jgi:3-oxoacyl-[acyl-carrier-protein] synthase-3